jgi:hypothetical protein
VGDRRRLGGLTVAENQCSRLPTQRSLTWSPLFVHTYVDRPTSSVQQAFPTHPQYRPRPPFQQAKPAKGRFRSLGAASNVTISCSVTNTGDREGDEVLMLFHRPPTDLKVSVVI